MGIHPCIIRPPGGPGGDGGVGEDGEKEYGLARARPPAMIPAVAALLMADALRMALRAGSTWSQLELGAEWRAPYVVE